MTVDFRSIDSLLASAESPQQALEALKEAIRKLSRDKKLHMLRYRGDLRRDLCPYIAWELGFVIPSSDE